MCFLFLFSAFSNLLLYPMLLLCFFSATWHWIVAHGYLMVQWRKKNGYRRKMLPLIRYFLFTHSFTLSFCPVRPLT